MIMVKIWCKLSKRRLWYDPLDIQILQYIFSNLCSCSSMRTCYKLDSLFGYCNIAWYTINEREAWAMFWTSRKSTVRTESKFTENVWRFFFVQLLRSQQMFARFLSNFHHVLYLWKFVLNIMTRLCFVALSHRYSIGGAGDDNDFHNIDIM